MPASPHLPAPPYLCLGGAALAAPCMSRGSSWPNCALHPTPAPPRLGFEERPGCLGGWRQVRTGVLASAAGRGLGAERERPLARQHSHPTPSCFGPFSFLYLSHFRGKQVPGLRVKRGPWREVGGAGGSGQALGAGWRGRGVSTSSPAPEVHPRRPLPLSPGCPVLWVLSV